MEYTLVEVTWLVRRWAGMGTHISLVPVLKVSNFPLYFMPFYGLEKEMATHSSILAWKIPWTEEPGRLQFMGLQRVGHD